MPDPQPDRRYRFGVFEADTAAGELRRQGVRVRLNAQPFQVLCMMLARPGELLTREEISRELWPDGTFVDYDHGVNSAINRIREALGDTAGNPRFVETLARRGYRFIAPVEPPVERPLDRIADAPPAEPAPLPSAALPDAPPASLFDRVLASPEELPRVSHRTAQTLFILLQLLYLGFYVGALANLAEIDDLLSPLSSAPLIFTAVAVTAALLIPARAFVITIIAFHAPRARQTFLRIWPLLLLLDIVWALSPFLLLHHINYGVALACMALLVYSPFAQRSLVLMGAGSTNEQ